MKIRTIWAMPSGRHSTTRWINVNASPDVRDTTTLAIVIAGILFLRKAAR